MQRDRLLSTYSGLLAISQRQTERLFPNLLRGRYAASVGARNAHLLQYAPLPALRLPCLARARYDLRTGSEIQFRAMDRILDHRLNRAIYSMFVQCTLLILQNNPERKATLAFLKGLRTVVVGTEFIK